MNQINTRIFALLLAVVLVFSIVPQASAASSSKITTTPTGYTSAADVQYKTYSQGGKQVIANWGARGEDCVFLSSYAASFYTGSYTYEKLIANNGGTSQSNAKDSALYTTLKTLMSSKHRHETNYGETRYLYQYTDCLSNNPSKISSFYSGGLVSGTWDGGSTWNREHTWPNSKGLNGNDENDIMMLRPTKVSENSSRGNTAYGESSRYYDPGESVRGDCARIVLYVYVRWGNTGNMWGSSGVMENMNILLKWMEEDPVDTWEMGRNDAVQSITGTRNVFVDYPELAFLLFGREIPSGMTTPSGKANGGSTPTPTPTPSCKHTNTEIRNASQPTCTATGYTGDTYCKDCGVRIATGSTLAKTPHREARINVKEATCCEDGYTGDLVCPDCGLPHADGEVIPATGQHSFGEWTVVKEATADEPGLKERVCTVGGFKETQQIPVTPEPTEPTEPTEPSEPTNPTDPTDATKPTDPTVPSSDTEHTPEESGSQDYTVVIAIAAITAVGVVALVIVLIRKKK